MASLPNDYPTDLIDVFTLPDGRRIRVRALKRCEEGPVRELFAHLSARSRYQRFLSPMPSLPDSIARQLSCGDYQRQLAVIAVYKFDTDEEETIGLGSFGAIDDATAEVALVVRDDWQRQHVGTELANRILQAAEARGFRRFVANVLHHNMAIRRLLGHVGLIVAGRFSAGVAELAFVRSSRSSASTAAER
jgi:RimJ/RimL family protein N-acetyltransferase